MGHIDRVLAQQAQKEINSHLKISPREVINGLAFLMDGWPDARRVLYMIAEPAAHRFRIMPGADRMPVRSISR
jgi:hypothetical protein